VRRDDGYARMVMPVPPPLRDDPQRHPVRLGRLAEDFPEIAEPDLNPALAGPHGSIAVDVKLRLEKVGDEPDPYLRDLLAGRSVAR
jgi:hypothetical protein